MLLMTIDRQTNYGFGTKTRLSYRDALDQIKAHLKDQGFGVLTEIDVQQTMKEKRGVDFPPYAILGACNPPLAEQALRAEPSIGLLLPCNVVVREEADGVVVEAMDPETALGIVGNPALQPIALEAKTRLQAAIEQLPKA
jgi:uncharacterized protein (DUF302 family)